MLVTLNLPLYARRALGVHVLVLRRMRGNFAFFRLRSFIDIQFVRITHDYSAPPRNGPLDLQDIYRANIV